MHVSIPIENSVELINITPVNPLISKCQIKVCYVGDEPNRNRSVITKDVARQMANSIPGSPIVGYYNENTEDFEEHNRQIDLSNGQFKIKDTTRPYGFVDFNAKIWFEKFEDDGVVHEYLMTEGWLWTGQYPECKRVVEKGNNQSMELDDKIINAYWTKDGNGKPRFFIINEAIMSKLCILGEKYEPCFEGSQITKVQFAFDDESKSLLTDFICQMKEIIKEGGTTVNKYAVNIGDSIWTAVYSAMDAKEESFTIDAFFEEDGQKYAVIRSGDDYLRMNFSLEDSGDVVLSDELTVIDSYTPAEEPQFALADVDAFVDTYKKKKKDEDEDKEDKPEDKEDSEKKPEDKGEDSEDDDDEEDEDKKKKKKKYSLDEVEEYQTLLTEHETLQNEFTTYRQTSEETIATLNAQIEELNNFKLAIERKDKEHMINVDFCMVDDSLKADIVKNIDTYSLDEIEKQLCVICVRNKINFNLDDENKDEKPVTFSLNDDEDESMPAWIRASLETEKRLKK